MVFHKHPIYRAWIAMRQRCENPNNTAYKFYGGKGVKVCPQWGTFAKFLADVGEPPAPGFTLDRINPSGDYEPGNVRWASRFTQATNTKIREDNSSGLKGVSWFHRTNRWFVFINHEKKRVALGYYEDFFEACCVRKSAEHFIWSGPSPHLYIASLKDRLKAIPNKGLFKNGHSIKRKSKSVP
ncbi:hypothetical protein [Rhodoferax koreensis]|uniref:hypothetical protein n=1 Tax=Rhodoferax koreensis TaxID=1842727 RepID=UPI0012FF9B29|nr:hypothetical protein [Rhodoferax koreense]